MKQMPLSDYIGMFARLRRANSRQGHWPEAVKNQAPHKPLLLLAVLDLVHRGVITTPFIAVSGDLVGLNELFTLYWRRVVPLGQTSSIAFPFSCLSRAGEKRNNIISRRSRRKNRIKTKS